MAVAFMLLLLLLLSSATSAAADDSKIPIPSSLSPASNSSSVWLSPSRKFAFGFYETPNGYAVCIFYTGFSDRPVVWTAADKFNPILPRNVFSLEINNNGIQLLQHEGSDTFIYQQIASPEEDIAWASMLDNGNFVLCNSHGKVIWQSFDHPTDTLLPGQHLPPDGELVSRASETDLGRGMFRLKMQFDGNLVQYPVSTQDTGEHAYFASHTVGRGKNVSLYLDNDGYLRLQNVNGNSSLYDLTNRRHPVSGIAYRATVDSDGIFRVYNRSLNREGNWTSMWSSIDDKCEAKGICGANSICSYEDQTVSCKCLPGFSNSSAGCNEDYSVHDCRNKNPEVEYGITRLPNVTWTTNNDDLSLLDVSYIITEEDCGRACLNDCNCVVALFQDGDCFRQTLPLRYGRRSMSASSVTLVRVATLHAPSPPVFTAPNGSGSGEVLPAGPRNGLSHLHLYKIIIIKGVSIGLAVLVISTFIIYYLIKQRGFGGRDKESKQNVNKFLLSHGSLTPTRYSYKEIRKITKSFREKLGQGGYGIVYKGKLPDGQLVAVKVLRETHNNAEEFVNEVASISRTSHVNIVNLLGFCFERKKRALIYQFMPNKSLDKFIYKNGSVDAECSLEWNKLYEIAVGVARGLEYLHKGCNTRIVHFDIKPQNILLDEDFCPKISDFGLAKLCMKKQSVISMLGTRGTVGYIAPEVFSRNFGVVSHKSDVYSYGIMLLQMAEARTNVEVKSFETSDICYLEKIYKHVLVQNEKIYALVREEEEEVVRRMLMVGFWCIQTTPSDRPSMNNVVDMLEGNLQSIPIPPLPLLLCSPKPQLSCSLSVIVETQS